MAWRLSTGAAFALTLALVACGKKQEAADTASVVAPDASSPPVTTPTAADATSAADAAPAATDAAAETAAAVPASLSPAGLDARRPRVSPDGKRVAFEGGPDGKRDIYLVGIDGAGLQAIAADPADDRDPSWTGDGKRLVFSSNRGGRYDLYMMDVDPIGSPTALGVGKDVEAFEPSVSPLRYTFSAVTPDSCATSGASGTEVDSYEKLVYTRVTGQAKEVWFRSLNGKHNGRVSPKGASCWGARFSGDGLSLVMTCADGEKRVVHDAAAAWDQDFASALKAVGYAGGYVEEDKGPAHCDDAEQVKEWESDDCFKKLPRRYARYAPAPVPDPSGALEGAGYSTNQILLLGTSAAGAATRERDTSASWAPLEVPGAERVTDFDWAPDGASVVLEQKAADGTHALVVAPTAYYLQDVKDLHDYPELWGAGRSERLAKNRFVARGGQEKEMFAAYDKVMYARRAPYVSADATLQVVRDEISTLLKNAEEGAAAELLELTRGLMDEYAARPDSGESRFLATQFGVAWAVLAAADALPDESGDGEYVPEEEKKAQRPPLELMREKLPEVLKELPASIAQEVGANVTKALAHEGFVEVKVPGREAPVPVDFSQMKPRGHYAESDLAGYFIAMKWLSMVPLPLDASAVELVRVMEKKGLIEGWKKIDAMVAAFMGRPVDVTVSHIQDLLAKEPGILEPFDKEKAMKAFTAALGELGIRGLAGALADDKGAPHASRELSFMLFPLRLGMDVPTFTGLTHPSVDQRGLPSAVDVFAALDVPAAVRVGTEQAKGQEWQAKYEAELGKLRGAAPGKDAPLWSGDLYHGWLALLRTLATPMKTPAEARMLFSDNPAWEDRLLSGALGGYAELKHDAVLYAFQDFSAECDSAYAVMTYVEQPILPPPRGFVEPNPEFFRAAAALAKKAYAAFSPEAEPTVSNLFDGEGNPIAMNGRIVAERLGAIAELEVKGQPIPAADLELVRTIGGTFEAVFLASQSSQGQGSGEGRKQRGLALVTDIHTNVTSQLALEIGVGRVDRLYVAVPDAIGARMTEGGIFSFYEFTQPIGDRLTDEQWNQRILEGSLPARPAWVSSFFEAAPK